MKNIANKFAKIIHDQRKILACIKFFSGGKFPRWKKMAWGKVLWSCKIIGLNVMKIKLNPLR